MIRALNLAVWLLCAEFGSAAQSKVRGSEAPIWSQEVLEDLSSNRPEHFIPGAELDGMHSTGVAFLNDRQVIVYAHEPSGQLSSRRSHEIISAFRQRLRILDAQSGETTLIKDFNVGPHGSALQVTTGGVLINTGETVKLYTTDFATVQNVTIPPVDKSDMVFTSVSPTGKTIMLNHFNPKLNVSHLDVFDADTLNLKHSWNQSPRLYYDYSISDKGIAASGVFTTDFGRTSWTNVGHGIGHCGGNVPILYTDEELVYGCSKLIVVSVNGQVLMTDSFPSSDEASPKRAIARGGRFVAVSLRTVEAKKHLLTESSRRITATRIVVYDLSLKKQILTLIVDPLPKSAYDFALSPDGTKLVVLNDRRVSVYSIPSP